MRPASDPDHYAAADLVPVRLDILPRLQRSVSSFQAERHVAVYAREEGAPDRAGRVGPAMPACDSGAAGTRQRHYEGQAQGECG